MRVGLSSASFYGRMETEEMALHLRDFPLETCEIFLETHSEYNADFGCVVRENLDGLPCVSVHPKGTQFEPDLFGQSKRQVADALDIFTRICDAGGVLGAKYYVMHGPGTINTQRRPEQIRDLIPRMAQLQTIAAAHGMQVLWENVSWCSMRTPEDVQAVRTLLPEMGFVLDVKQAYRAGATPQAVLAAMGERIRHVHALDMDADGRLNLPGEGGMTDWPALKKQLSDLGYAGAVILEPYTVQPEGEAALRRSLCWLRELFT